MNPSRPFSLAPLPTAGLEAVFAVLLAKLGGRVADAELASIARLARRLEAAARKLARLASWNARVAKKRAMLADAAWRADVLEALGGLRALDRWEARAGRAPSARTRTQTRCRAQAGVDQGACGGRAFAREWTLPALPRDPRGRATQSTRGSCGQRAIVPPVPDRPIPVWPCELRGLAKRGAEAKTPAPRPQSTGGVGTRPPNRRVRSGNASSRAFNGSGRAFNSSGRARVAALAREPT